MEHASLGLGAWIEQGGSAVVMRRVPERETVDCPLCKQPAGEACVVIRSGRPAFDTHMARVLLARGDADGACRAVKNSHRVLSTWKGR